MFDQVILCSVIGVYHFWTYGNVRRIAHSLFPNPKTSCFSVNGGEGHNILCTYYSLSRKISQHRFSFRVPSPFALYKAKNKILLHGSGYINFYGLPVSKTISQQLRIAWRRFSSACSNNGPALPPISQIVCAVSLALTRSNLVAPGVIAIIIGELAWTRQTWAEAEYLPTRDTLYMHAQDGHVYLTSFVYLVLEGFILLLRAIYLAILFSPCITMAPFVDSLGVEFRKRWLHIVHLTLEKAGPAFVKWGQWAATRPDLFPRDLCSELAKLHANAPAHSFSFTKRTIERAFGRKLSAIFENFDKKPVASGSVAQVHQATLKYRYPGQKIKPIVVAVKVDLSREAAHLSRFIYNFRRCKDVSFPKPLYPLVHPSVLVETYEQGESVLHYVEELEAHEQIKSALAQIGTHALLKMLLVDNFIHADMHPGNILVRVTHSKPSHKQILRSKPLVILLDVDLTAELSKKDRVNLMDFFKAVALQDGRTAAECTLRLSKQQNCPNPRAFIEEVENSLGFWRTHVVHPADCMQQLLEQVRRHKVNIDADICTVMVTTLVLEGWQRKLDPDYDVLQALNSLLFRVDLADSLFDTIEKLMAP
ncbi:probable serine/threonine-protein kinase abkC isoform X3 [Carya illinoinensis]|uniref:probable serine/threonine-protein kinase abkC isoform X3 n=1 Tax=Carya illinoinensis TaxID=32201 RepID=UPI001C7208AD|nr:probable serine/threonine-protein kinase abkC isoform X3 [Carya illinoinensis]